MAKIIIIGMGGIGQWLIDPLCLRLAHLQRENKNPFEKILLVDGGEYKERKAYRQKFHRLGNKAEVNLERLQREFPALQFEAAPFYLIGTDDAPIEAMEDRVVRVDELIGEEDWIILCVDNAKTRNRVDTFCSTLKIVKLFNGGNNLTDGATQVYIRRGGRDITPSLCQLHPDTIGDLKEKAPYEMSCEELEASGVPQIIGANLFAATLLYQLFDNELERQKIQGNEVYFDTKLIAARPVSRKK